ncbi:MAG: D-tyrosyl-tRNA(Tyr) deacylase [Planctomycetales bacterium]|nr:D-tyrosyl-tRNA(Tyr) deacylase [Planctomycetales bacterium]
MRACVQRVAGASVTVDGQVVGEIGRGLLVLLGVEQQDAASDVAWMADKCVDLRIFEDDAGKMNCSLEEQGGAMLVVSQFTLLGDARKGRRPSFISAAPPDDADRLYLEFVERVRARGVAVATGVFRAHMDVALVNDGPVTILLDSRKRF